MGASFPGLKPGAMRRRPQGALPPAPPDEMCADDGPHPEKSPYIPRRRATSREVAVHPEMTAHIRRRRRASRDDAPYPGEVAGPPETMAWIWRSCSTAAGVTKRGERAGHAPRRRKEVSYFDSAGEEAAGDGWPSGVSGGSGLVGFALRTRPRNGCRPNCASFSERRP